MAGLWCKRGSRGAYAALARGIECMGLVASLMMLPGCSELAQSGQAASPPPAPPAYVSLSAQYLMATLKDRFAYADFEISAPRWVDTIKGWAWLACVHFQDHGHQRSYALFIQNNAVVDARYAVETDACGTQTYTPFDLVTGELGRPTAPVQPPLY